MDAKDDFAFTKAGSSVRMMAEEVLFLNISPYNKQTINITKRDKNRVGWHFYHGYGISWDRGVDFEGQNHIHLLF